MPYRVSKTRFGELVEQALSELPRQFADFLEQVPVQVMSRPPLSLLRSMGIEDGEDLLGLYEGSDLLEASETEGRGTPMPNQILIFQENIEGVSENEQDLVREVRTTVLHELGHHFGMSEEDLRELGYD
jgi:predicted Zn-dependent protease with MMP-like domain